MNLILNRNFELPKDGWYQLAPLGEFPHAAAGITQIIDEAACTQMVAAFETVKNFSGNFPGLLIDFDHFSLDAAKHSEAAGWITDLKFSHPSSDLCPQSSGTGLFAQIRWSDTGEAAVTGGRYRFLSPVWAKSDCEDLGNDRLRPVRLLNAAVTNDPNLKGILPLSNRNASPQQPATSNQQLSNESENRATFDFPPLSNNTNKETRMQPVIDALLNKLNLPADTAQDAIITAIENMAAPDDVAALTNRAETAEQSLADLQVAQLESDADAFLEDNAALIGNRDEVRTQFIENRTLTEAVFKNLKAPAAPSTKPPAPSSKPLHNRDSKIAATRNRDASTSESKAVKIRNRTSEIMKAENIGYPAAFRRAEQELAD
jgi:phage I-like protein